MVDGLSKFVTMIEASARDGNIVHFYGAIFHGPVDLNEFRFESLSGRSCGEYR